MSAFLAMGGYAAYVWPTFGLAVLVLGGLLFLSLRDMREAEAELAGIARAPGARRAGAP